MESETVKNGVDQMSLDERKVYDRQIRLWGYDGQNKLRTIKVLLIGLQGLGAEIAKNLILSGIHTITLKDHTDVSILDRCSQFLIPIDSVERNRAKASLSNAQKLNPNVRVIADTTPIEENIDNYISSFDIIIATECSPATYKRLNDNCRKAKKVLFIADVYGLFGYFYQDITFEHSTYDQVFPIKDETIVPVIKNQPLSFILTSALLKFQNDANRKPNPDTCEEDIEELKLIINSSINQEVINPELFDDYYNELFCELSPTTSILGGMVAETALGIIMGNNAFESFTKYNVFFYDNVTHEGKFHLI